MCVLCNKVFESAFYNIFLHKNTDQGVSTPDTIRIKLTGDGTQIGRELNEVNIAFAIVDEGETAQSVNNNYSIAIVKIEESYKTKLVLSPKFSKSVFYFYLL